MAFLTEWIIGFGYVALFGTIFAESGLFFGFFLPGDSLLFTAGLFAAKGDLNIAWVCLGCFIAAVLGDQVGYWFGATVGAKTKFIKKEHLDKTEAFYQKYGRATLILARFTPVVRTFAPVLAGVAQMPYANFLTYNIVGGALWGITIPVLGYFLGNAIPDIDHYLLPIIIVIIILSVLPALFHMKSEIKEQFKKIYNSK
jgi:membrane-associated protein